MRPGVRERGQKRGRALGGDAVEVVKHDDTVLARDGVQIAPELLLIPVLRGVQHVHGRRDHRGEVAGHEAPT